MDIRDIFKEWVELKGWVFSYGNSANRNLLESNEIENTIYLLLDSVKETEGSSLYGGDVATTYSSNFILGIKSDFDNVYDGQNYTEIENSRYVKNIQPLKDALKEFKDIIDCSELKRTNWEVIEVINQFDINLDGLLVTFTLTHE